MPADEQKKILDLLSEIRDRVATLEVVVRSFHTAFPQNDLGAPDLDGHRRDHVTRRNEAKTMDSYKISVTKSVLSTIAIFLLGLTSLGFVQAIAEKIIGK